jgi:hypothetical protein
VRRAMRAHPALVVLVPGASYCHCVLSLSLARFRGAGGGRLRSEEDFRDSGGV